MTVHDVLAALAHGYQSFTDHVLCPDRCTRRHYDLIRDRVHLIPGDEVLVDVSAYDAEAEKSWRWCAVVGLAPGDAAVFPYKVQIPGRGEGQYAAGEIHGWRRPVSLHRALAEHAAEAARA